jgi:hypothetical protein
MSEFGEISVDDKRIITMEWIIEGIALIFICCPDHLNRTVFKLERA